MKKSEMIMLLDKELFNQKCMDQNITGQDILRIVEEAGMLPPAIKTDCGISYSSGVGHEWEDEDEKK